MLMQMTVAENLMFERLPQRRGIVDYREMNRRAAELLEEVGLDVRPTTPVARLGVAQMQLIEIAKTLVFESKLLILDEPTATLTAKEVDRLFDILRRLKARGVTIVYISHRLQEIGEVGDRVTVLRDGQLVATRALAGLTIPDIVRMMVGRSVTDERAFRADVAVSGEALRVVGLRRDAQSPEVSFASARARSSGSRGWSAAAGRRRRGRSSARTARSPARSMSKASACAIESPRDAVESGLCLMTEDRKGQGLLLGMSCAQNITITDLAKISHMGLIERDAERDAATRLVSRPAHQDALDRPDRAQFLGRQPAEGGDRQMALPRLEGAHLRRADPRHRRRRAGGNLRPPVDARRQGRGVLFISSDLPELIAICHRILVFAKGRVVGEVARAEFDQHRILSMAYEEYGT